MQFFPKMKSIHRNALLPFAAQLFDSVSDNLVGAVAKRARERYG